jgi:hypothetical protein
LTGTLDVNAAEGAASKIPADIYWIKQLELHTAGNIDDGWLPARVTIRLTRLDGSSSTPVNNLDWIGGLDWNDGHPYPGWLDNDQGTNRTSKIFYTDSSVPPRMDIWQDDCLMVVHTYESPVNKNAKSKATIRVVCLSPLPLSSVGVGLDLDDSDFDWDAYLVDPNTGGTAGDKTMFNIGNLPPQGSQTLSYTWTTQNFSGDTGDNFSVTFNIAPRYTVDYKGRQKDISQANVVNPPAGGWTPS